MGKANSAATIAEVATLTKASRMAASRSQWRQIVTATDTHSGGPSLRTRPPLCFLSRLGLRFMKLELRAVTKHFGSLAANENVDLIVEPDRYTDCSGEVQARPR